MQKKASLSSIGFSGAARIVGYFPVATVCLIALNVAVFAGLKPGDPQDTASWYALIPDRMQFLALFTSLFIHFAWAHLLVNVIFLWVFGRKVEQAVGPIEFLMFYIGSGFLAGLLHVAVVMTFLHSEADIPLVGASGAVSGVIGMYAVKFRKERLYVSGREIPTFPLLLAWFLVQIALGVAGINQTDWAKLDLRYVGYWSHIGGFVFGMTAGWLTGLRGGKEGAKSDQRRITLLEAARQFEMLTTADPEDPFAHSELARVRAQLGDQNASVGSFLRAADLHKSLGMRDEALFDVQEMLRTWPEVTLSHDSLFRAACLFEQIGEYEEAAARLSWLSTTAPCTKEGEMALLKLAQIEIDHLGQRGQGVNDLQRLLSEHPNSRWAEHARQMLERVRGNGK